MLTLAFVHRDEVPAANPPLAAPPDEVDENEVLARHEREELAGLSFFKRSQRRAARERAGELAAQEVQQEQAKRERGRQALQASLDAEWKRLIANDHHVVMEVLEAAFEDNEMPAAVIDVHEASATVLMKIGSPSELVPEREVTQTPTGKPTHRRRNKSTINALYAEIMASHIVATARETLAVAPGLVQVRVLVIRGDRLGGGLQLIPLYAGSFERAQLAREDWDQLNVLGFVESHGQVHYRGQAQEIAPLRTKGDVELRATLDEIAAHLEWKPAP